MKTPIGRSLEAVLQPNDRELRGGAGRLNLLPGDDRGDHYTAAFRPVTGVCFYGIGSVADDDFGALDRFGGEFGTENGAPAIP